MHESLNEIRLFLSSAARDSGLNHEPIFRIPDIQNMAKNSRAFITVERFLPESSLLDNDDLFVLQLTSHAIPHQYDSITKTSANIIAVSPQDQRPGSYKPSAAESLKRIPINNLLGQQVELKLRTLKTKSNILDYYVPYFVNAQGVDQTTVRDFYCVIKIEYCTCDDL